VKTWLSNLLSGVLGAALGTLATLVASTFDYWNKSRELDIRMVDVAVTILSAKDEGTKSRNARVYALELLEKYGGVEIPNKKEWAAEGELPIGDFPIWGMPGWAWKAAATTSPLGGTTFNDSPIGQLNKPPSTSAVPQPMPLPEGGSVTPSQ